MFFALSCLNPYYVNKHFDQTVAFAAAMYFSMNNCSAITVLENKVNLFKKMEQANIKNCMAHPYFRYSNKVVGKYSAQVWLEFSNKILGYTAKETIDMNRIVVLAANEIGGSSLQNIMHWIQEIHNDSFKFYDFGEENNIKKYGSKYPPIYNKDDLKKLEVPVYIFYYSNNILITPAVIKKFLKELPEGGCQTEYFLSLNHAGLWSNDAYINQFPKVISFLSRSQILLQRDFGKNNIKIQSEEDQLQK